MMSGKIGKAFAAGVMTLIFAAFPWDPTSGQPASDVTLYTSPHGLSSVAIDDTIALAVPGQDRNLPLRVVYPERVDAGQGERHPVIVLSHGTFSSGKRYDPVAVYWAARGYVVILPDHVDANYGVIPKKNEDMFRVIRTRVTDMSLVLDALDEVEQRIPALAGRLDRQRLIAAGHSVGTQIAMIVTGLRVRNPSTQEIMQSDETRYGLLVMLSDPGKMAMMPAKTWTGSLVPTLLSTGSEDFGVMGDGRRVAEYQNEILSAEDNPQADRYFLSIERGDHYFGGLIHKDTDSEPDNEGLAIFNSVSTAFLDAYAGNEQVALKFLREVDLPAATVGRANLTLERHN
jgi:hypothetical protein